MLITKAKDKRNFKSGSGVFTFARIGPSLLSTTLPTQIPVKIFVGRHNITKQNLKQNKMLKIKKKKTDHHPSLSFNHFCYVAEKGVCL